MGAMELKGVHIMQLVVEVALALLVQMLLELILVMAE